MQGFPLEVVTVIETYDTDARRQGHKMWWRVNSAGYRGVCERCSAVALLDDHSFEFGMTGDPRERRCDRLLELD